MSFVHSVEELIEAHGSGLTGKAVHWERVRLGDVAQVINGFPFPSGGFNNEAGEPVLRIRDITAGSVGTYFKGNVQGAPRVEHGNLVVGMDGDFNSRLWPGDAALINQRVCKISPDEAVYSSSLLAYVLPGYLKLVNDHTSAVTVKHLSSRTISDLPLPLPPRPEQDRLASKLDELFSRIDEGERALERVSILVERYRQSVLKAAVTGELTRAWRENNKHKLESGEALLVRILTARREAWEEDELKRMKTKGITPANDKWKQKYEEPSSPYTTDLPELPDGWSWATLDQVGFVTGGLTKNQKRGEHELRRPFLRVANVYANRLELDDMHEIGVAGSEIDRVQLKKGDVLVVEGNGSIEQVGRVALWDGSIEGCVHQNHLIKVRCAGPLPSWYVLIWCMSPMGRAQIRRVASSTAGLHTLSISKIQALPIPIPTDAELAYIEDRFSQMDSLVVSQRDAIRREAVRSSSLRKTILRAAFSGELVRQDQTDEPASTLLKRIADECGADTAAPKRGRKKKITA